MQTHVSRFLARLKGVTPTGTGWAARCPNPDHGGGKGDRTPSLSISVGEDDKIVFHCHGGCPPDAVLDTLGIDYADLWPADADEPIGPDSAVDPGESAVRQRGVEDKVFVGTVYEALLARLALTDDHRHRLRERGLTDGEIDRRQYRSLIFLPMRQATASLRDEYGDRLLEVPGFIKPSDKVVPVDVPRGILVPVRGHDGNIVAIQVRRDDNTGPRYGWFSGGPTTSGSPAHVPLGVPTTAEVRLTEGPLKADVAFALGGVPTIGVAGVTNWRPAVGVLRELDVKKVRLAFDADSRTKKNVAQALAECHAGLADEFEVALEVWLPEQVKGLDDLLLSGRQPRLLQGKDALDHLDRITAGDGTQVRAIGVDLPGAAGPCNSRGDPPAVGEGGRSQKGPDRFPYGTGDPAPFPLASLPDDIAAVAQEMARALNCPVDFVAGAMLAVAGAAIGRSRQVEPKEDWGIAPRLFLGIVGDPGSAKTPAMTKVMKPLWRKNAEWLEEYQAQRERYEEDLQVYEAERKEQLKDVSKRIEEDRARRRRAGRTEAGGPGDDTNDGEG